MKKITILILLGMVLTAYTLHQKVNPSFPSDNGVKVIAHRGAKDMAPENTLSAYRAAVALDVDYIEIDLRMTKDGHLVAMHDDNVETTTDGTGRVSEFTLKEIKKLDAGSWFGREFKGEEIPSIDEIFEEFGSETKYYIETRLVDGSLGMEETLVQKIFERGLEEYVVIQSFSEESLRYIYELDVNIPLTQLLYPDSTSEVNAEELKKYVHAVGPYGLKINQEFVKRIQSSGLEVHVWFDNSNEKSLIDEALSYGVDAVFTDFIDNTEEIIKQKDNEQK